MGDATLQGLVDARLELGGAVLVEEARKGGDDGAKIAAALGGVGEQALTVGRGPDQPVLPAQAPGMTLVPGQAGNVLGDLDAGALVEAARVGGDDVSTVEDAHLVERRDDDEGASHMGVWHGVIVGVEAGVGRLADGDLDPFVGGEAVAGQGDEGTTSPPAVLAWIVLAPGWR